MVAGKFGRGKMVAEIWSRGNLVTRKNGREEKWSRGKMVARKLVAREYSHLLLLF